MKARVCRDCGGALETEKVNGRWPRGGSLLCEEHYRAYLKERSASNEARGYDTAYFGARREANKDRLKALKLVREEAIRNDPVKLAHRRLVKLKIQEKRRAIVLGCTEHYTLEDVQSLLEAQCWKCFYCPASLRDGFHVDHMTPLSRRGGNGKNNICCACPSCNCAKGDKTVEEFQYQVNKSA